MTKSGKRPTTWKQLGAAVCITGMAGVAVSAQAFAQATENAAPATASTSERPAPYAMSPESSTLPVNVMRARIPYVSATSSGNAYYIDGKKIDGGLSANIVATGLALEYGFSEKLTFGMLVPFVSKNEVGMNANNFKNQRGYFNSKRNFYEAASALMIKQGICSDNDGCFGMIEQGYAFPYDLSVQLTTGEPLTVKAGVPLNQGVHHLVANAAKPVSGETGMGDIDLGLKYRWFNNETMGHALGLVVHVPTGKYEDVTLSQRATGRGIMELAVRSSFDYKLSDDFIAGWQHSIDYAVGKGKIKRTKLLANTELSDIVSTAGEGSFADGFANNNEFERPGIRSSGFVDVKTSFARFSPMMNSLGGKVRYGYDFDTAVRVEDMEDAVSNGFRGATERSSMQTLGLGLVFDGFQLENRIPVRVTWDIDAPVAGANKAVAAVRNAVVTELFYKF